MRDAHYRSGAAESSREIVGDGGPLTTRAADLPPSPIRPWKSAQKSSDRFPLFPHSGQTVFLPTVPAMISWNPCGTSWKSAWESGCNENKRPCRDRRVVVYSGEQSAGSFEAIADSIPTTPAIIDVAGLTCLRCLIILIPVQGNTLNILLARSPALNDLCGDFRVAHPAIDHGASLDSFEMACIRMLCVEHSSG